MRIEPLNMSTNVDYITFLYRYKHTSCRIRTTVEIIRSLNLPTVNCVLTFDRADDLRILEITNSKSKKPYR